MNQSSRDLPLEALFLLLELQSHFDAENYSIRPNNYLLDALDTLLFLEQISDLLNNFDERYGVAMNKTLNFPNSSIEMHKELQRHIAGQYGK
jgi:hypothetical protein